MALAVTVAATTIALVPASGAAAATLMPSETPTGVIRTSPFQNVSTSMADDEASAYVVPDDSLWLAQDRGRLYEVDATTGDLIRTMRFDQAGDIPPAGGTGPLATSANYNDIEGLAYDATSDVLYVFSGSNDPAVNIPTVFRMTREGDGLQVQDYKLLPGSGTDFTAAAWNPTDNKIYVGKRRVVQTYDFASNVVGPDLGVDVSGILGMDFSPDGTELFISRTEGSPRVAQVVNVAWPSKSENWRLDVLPGGVQDARAVAYVDGALYVSDGFDDPNNPPQEHAVHVFGERASTPDVTAGFEVDVTSGEAPLAVRFTDESTGSPTRWDWDFGDFGDNDKSSEPSPTYTYAKPGSYTVKLRVSTLTRADEATATIEVKDTTAPRVSLKRPAISTSVSAWRTLKGTATDAGAGVKHVKVRMIEKRGRAWYGYNATKRAWVKAGSKARAWRVSRPAVLTPATSTWSYRVTGLTKGYLVVTLSATDRAGNTSAAKTYTQSLTKR